MIANEYLRKQNMSKARLDTIALRTMLTAPYAWDNQVTFKKVKETITTAGVSVTYTIDLSLGTVFNITLNGNTAIAFPTPEAGAQFTLNLRQDATGGRSVTWPILARWANDLPPTLTSLGLRTDTINFVSDGNVWMGYEGGRKYNTTLGPIGWTFTYSSIWSAVASTPPTQANMSDETNATYWGNASTESNPFLRADFGEPRTLSYIRYLAAPTSASWGPTYTNGADLQWSLDGSTWTTITTISNASETVVNTYVLPNSVMARYVRLYKSGAAFLACGDLSFG